MFDRVHLSRRGVLAGALALSACAPAVKAPASLADLTLRVATFKGGVRELLSAAGLDQTPYKIAYSEFASGQLISEAINARAVDTGSMSEIPPIFSAGASPLLRLVAVQRGDVNAQVILTPPGSALRAPADLKGKRVGYVRATTAHYLLLKYLSEGGLALSDIDAVALSPQDGLAAFGRGALDAWVIYGVQGALARAQFNAKVLATGLNRLSGNYVHAALQDALDDDLRRRAVLDLIERQRTAWAWAQQNPDAWSEVQGKTTGAPAALYLQQHRERSGPTQIGPVDAAAIASQQGVADAFARANVIPKPVDVSSLWDPRLGAALK